MTTQTPSSTTSPATTTPAAEPITATVKLRAASSQGQFRVLAAIYLALLAVAWWPAAIVAAFLMPLFCEPTHPRRALWLWAMGLLAGGAALMKANALFGSLGGMGVAFTKDPTWAGIATGLAVAGAGLMLWHLTWVKSPRRM